MGNFIAGMIFVLMLIASFFYGLYCGIKEVYEQDKEIERLKLSLKKQNEKIKQMIESKK